MTERPSFPNSHIASCMDKQKRPPNKNSVTSCKHEGSKSHNCLVILFSIAKTDNSFKKEGYLHTIS